VQKYRSLRASDPPRSSEKLKISVNI
jgi:hypothetical protein